MKYICNRQKCLYVLNAFKSVSITRGLIFSHLFFFLSISYIYFVQGNLKYDACLGYWRRHLHTIIIIMVMLRSDASIGASNSNSPGNIVKFFWILTSSYIPYTQMSPYRPKQTRRHIIWVVCLQMHTGFCNIKYKKEW